jgi:membrane-associated phospholipid phosphatase
MFLAVFFLPRVSRRWRALLFAYPLVMMFTVLYCGEHYLADVLAGWGYVLATFALVGVVERWWQHTIGIIDQGRHRRRTRRVPGPPPSCCSQRVPLVISSTSAPGFRA